MNIFEIKKEYLELTNIVLDQEGELSPEVEAALKINKEELEVKAQNYGYVVLKLESEIDAIDAEILRLSALKKSNERTINRMKNAVIDALVLFDIIEVKTPTLKISLRSSSAVEVTNEDEVASEFFVEKTTRTVSKTLLKDAINEGRLVSGAYIKNNLSLRIK